ncbi:hypothetical protein H9660_14390, partial [Clostridium sp. Sa3CUN1]|nr:hypothetical protein [Clostridium gallinarum]
TRLGNSFLNDIREVINEEEKKKTFNNNSKIIINQKDVNRIKKIFSKDIEKIKNQIAYEKLQNEINYS